MKKLVKRISRNQSSRPESALKPAVQNANQTEFSITKSSGESELFSADKLRGSLLRSGADQEVVEEIVKQICSWLQNLNSETENSSAGGKDFGLAKRKGSITTRMIYDRAFQLLRRMTVGNAARYKLKKAMMELGPTGHPFEHFVGQIYKILGCEVEVGQVLDGLSVTHEMDVIATREVLSIRDLSSGSENGGKNELGLRPEQIIATPEDINKYLKLAPQTIVVAQESSSPAAKKAAVSASLSEYASTSLSADKNFPRRHQHLVECKFYISTGKNANVQVPLYVRSRINDIVYLRLGQPEYSGYSFSGGIVTNTRFTEDAIAFGESAGLKLLSWDYPRGAGLREIIDREKIFPVTVLTRLTVAQKQLLMERGIVICRQIAEDESVLDVLGLEPGKRAKIIEEVRQVAAN